MTAAQQRQEEKLAGQVQKLKSHLAPQFIT